MSHRIKDGLDNYEIKISSKEILNRFYEKRDSKAAKRKGGFFYFKLASSLLVAVSCIFAFMELVLPTGRKKDHSQSNKVSLPNNAVLIEDDKENHVAFQLLSGIELLDFIDNSATSNLLVRRKQNAPATVFGEIVNVFDKANELLNNSSFSNIDKNVYEGDFVVNNKTYPYMMEIKSEENIFVYYDSRLEYDGRNETETEFRGEIHYKNQIFDIVGEREEENRESEFEISIFIDRNNFIEIEQESENNKYEYSYLIHENGRKIYEIDYTKNYTNISLEIRDNSHRYRFTINEESTSTLIEYSYLDYVGTISLTFTNEGRIYIETTTKEEILKN